MKGLVFDIQRYSIHDGPGIRTVVFLKGCPLNCLWCCNPESQRIQPQLEFRKTLCQQCGQCISVCPESAIHPDVTVSPEQKIDRIKCTVCGECTFVCPQEALRISGRWMEPQEVMDQCLNDTNFFRRSGGGVTLSGGEPLAQPEFVLDLLQKLQARNIHTAIETTGFAPWEIIEQVAPHTDLFLFDVKHMDSLQHLSYTGVNNDGILTNLEKLTHTNSKIIIRIPLIPDYNDNEQNLQEIALLANRLSISEIHLMPFHQFGKEKYMRFGFDYALSNLAGIQGTQEGKKHLQQALNIFANAGINAQIGG